MFLKVKIKKKFVKTNGSKNISVILIINTLDIAFRKKAPQGESYQHVYDRVVTFIENELNQQQRRVVIVAHQVVIRCFFRLF